MPFRREHQPVGSALGFWEKNPVGVPGKICLPICLPLASCLVSAGSVKVGKATFGLTLSLLHLNLKVCARQHCSP